MSAYAASDVHLHEGAAPSDQQPYQSFLVLYPVPKRLDGPVG